MVTTAGMMLARSISRVAAGSARRARDGQRVCISSLVGGCNSSSSMIPVDEPAAAAVRPKVGSRPAAGCGVAALAELSKVGSCRRRLSSGRPPFDMGEDENEVDGELLPCYLWVNLPYIYSPIAPASSTAVVVFVAFVPSLRSRRQGVRAQQPPCCVTVLHDAPQWGKKYL